jgi:exodeoxyribonuclease VII large subunit
MSQPFLSSLFDSTERQPVSVSELTQQIRGALEKSFASVWVEGEISNFRAHSSGHWYFTLKDEFAQLRAACYRSSNQRIRFRLEDGMLVRARGRLSVYELKGEYQLIADSLEPIGAGALQLAFEQTKARLQAEGLFAPELKRTIPILPKRVGIVTSASGAAIRDILQVISRRTSSVHILIAAARVQGEGAAHEIVSAIRFLNEHQERAQRQGDFDNLIDVMIVGRGGGSIEDLWAFNEEAVARAIRKSGIPVICAVGHETDFTIADFVADLRAPTPSAAAEMVAAHEAELCARLAGLSGTLARSMRYRISGARNQVQELALSSAFDAVAARLRDALTATGRAEYRLHANARALVESAQRRLHEASRNVSLPQLRSLLAASGTRFDALNASRENAMAVRMETAERQLALAAAALDAMSPLRVLERGYAIAHDAKGHVVRDAETVSVGDGLRLKLWKGELDCRVEQTKNE